jgi:hypothetical protein
MTLQRLAARLLEGGVVAMALLLAAPAIATPDQSRQRPSDSGSTGRTAQPASPSSGGGSGGGSGSSGGQSGGSSENSGESSGSTRESSPPRTAQPSPGAGNREPERQRPHRRGGSGRDGFRGDGYYGGYYGRYYDPFWGPFWWRGWWGYYPYYGPGGYPYYRGDRWPGRDLGALDLDVSPGRAEVYLDGRYLGKVDAYDGFPRYLWLEKGTYDVVFYLDGYRTVARQITIYPGTVIDVDDRLEPGESVRPEELGPKTHERRDERLRNEREQRERYERGDDDWRDRVREERERRQRDDADADEDDADEDDAYEDDAGEEAEEAEIEGREDEEGRQHGRVSLDVEPRDASVYVDGRFVGTAEDLARSGLSLNPGRHHIAVVRPGHGSQERDFDVTAGEEVELEIELVEND